MVTRRFDLGPGLADHWRDHNCCAALIEGFLFSVVPDRIVGGLLVTPKIRLQLVVTPGDHKFTPEQWKRDSSICPPNWPTDFSLLLQWYRKISFNDLLEQAMSETRSRHMFAALSCDVQMLAEKVCFARIPAEVNLDALAQQWHTKSLQSRAYMPGPTLQQITTFELKKAKF